MERITSRTNPLCTHLRRLSSSAAYRRQRGEFLCESPKLLTEALLWHANVRTVVFSPRAQLPVLPEGVRQVEVPEDLLTFLAPSQTPQGVVFTCALEEQSLPATLPGRRYLVLDGVQDPGNVGTIVRTADAFGADGVVLLGGCADLYNPKTLRSTMGAVFRCPVWRCSLEELAAACDASGLPLYGTALGQDTRDVRRADYSRCAIAIGSEGKGLSRQVLALCRQTLMIPMRERCESLNAAGAAAVVLWEAARND